MTNIENFSSDHNTLIQKTHTVKFLGLLPRRTYNHLVAIKPNRVVAKSFDDIGSAASWANTENSSGSNLHWMLSEVSREISKKASEKDIDWAWGCHADIDVNCSPDLSPEQWTSRLDDTYVTIGQFHRRPSMIISSGGGFQLIWHYEEPLKIASQADIDTQKSRNRSLEAELKKLFDGKPLKVDSTHNIDRVLRLPGTINWPNQKKTKAGRKPVLAKLIYPNSGGDDGVL